MTLEEAIKGLQYEVKEAEGDGALDAVAYLQLGIEGLKRIVYLRLDMDCPHWMTLPGETKE